MMLAIRQPIPLNGFHIYIDSDLQKLVERITSQDCEIYKVPETIKEMSDREVQATLESLKKAGEYRTVREF